MGINVIIAGFGGQGVLMGGSVLVHGAMYEGKYVTWMPSYGVEMRGGTANCTVVISEEEIGSPVIGRPQNVIALNLPSKQKFEKLLKPGGLMIINSSLIEAKVQREDVNVLYIPLNKMADELGESRSLNMIALGAYIELTKVVTAEHTLNAITECFSKKREVIEINKKALALGMKFARENQCSKAVQPA
ncbi:MAG: 2-oxoacid:acceptor oxidoreductase family protein [Vampirovibrionia bacterium]